MGMILKSKSFHNLDKVSNLSNLFQVLFKKIKFIVTLNNDISWIQKFQVVA